MKKLLILLTTFLSIASYAQKEANVWYFGENAGLDFNTTPPTALTNGRLSTLEGCSSFADASGNLLFYSDGITVWDKNHNVMNYTNGNPANDLKGDPSSTQSGMIIPKPESSSIYYLFTVDDGPSASGPASGLHVYTIDMSLNGGAGQLIDEDKDGVFFKDLSDGKASQWTEKVAAVRGKDCNTYWVVSPTQSQFYAYKIDKTGIISTPVISTVGGGFTNRGNLKLSPDASKVLIANQSNNQATLFSFDNATGVVANDGVNLLSFADGQAYGVEFSRDSRKAYVSTTRFFTDDPSRPSTYKLFQFDLTKTDIRGSKHKVVEQNGFRGSLQLAPDGKIYVTIPQTYSNPAGFATHLDVIENPDADPVDLRFRKDYIDLKGKKSTQGLPPFISSLLIPIEIKDQISGLPVNNKTLQYCIGESKTIAPDPLSGTGVTYEWTFNNGTTTTTISNSISITLNNLTLANAGEYRLKVTLTDSCGNKVIREGVFKIEVYPATSATQPSDINFCDVDNDGFNVFDLQKDVTPQVLNGQDPAIFEVVYYLSMADATNNTTANALANPYRNPTAFSNQTIYARMHNKAAPKACADIKSFKLVVTGKPAPTKPADYVFCDDATVGTDTDGIHEFLLNTKDSEILGALDPAIYIVSYHKTLVGAQSNTDVINKTVPYRNETANNQTVYIRVENKNNVACNDTATTLQLVVNALPTINNVVELKQCDNDTDAFSDFNLEEARGKISTNFTNETFVFYESLANAQAATSPIANPTVYRNKTATSDKVWATVTNSNGCRRIAEVNLTVSTTGIPSTFSRSFRQCDDFRDINGLNNVNNNDTDGISSFDFSSVDAEIKNMFTAVGQKINVTYYRNEPDALAEKNAITDITNYRNIGYPNTQQIYVRVDSDLDNDCLGFGPHITLTVDPVPTAAAVANIELCDDFNSGAFDDGINTNINLRNYAATILGSQSAANFTVTFHKSAADANSGANAIPNDNNYKNTTRDRETIYVRVRNNATGCFNDHTKFDIIIHPLPTISNTIPNLEVCDVPTASDSDSRNRIAQNIPLGDRDVDVLNGKNPAQFEVSYHKTRNDAINGVNPLSKTTYANDPTTTNFPASLAGDDPATEIIFISMLNKTTGCRNGIATLQIIIHPEPNIPVNINNYVDCDNTSDSANDDTNSINGDITLKNKVPEILANYPVADHNKFAVTFHASQADARSGANPLNENTYQNTANNQKVFVRVVNNQSRCVNSNLSFDIIINPLPFFTVNTPVIVCLNNPQTRLEPINPLATYSYEWKVKGSTSTLSTANYLDVTKGGTYVVTATMQDGTGCQRTREIVVNESNNPTLKEEDIIIVDDTNNNRLNTYSIKIVTENNNLGIGDYQFALVDEKGDQTPFQDEPLFTNIGGGIYTVLVNDKNGCVPDASLEVSVIEYPKFLTPNNDGHNDTWKVKGANSSFYPSSNIYIYDRFGKPVATIPVDGEGWDGTYNGNTLPSNDYWFKIELVDKKGKVHQHNGHFSLLRK